MSTREATSGTVPWWVRGRPGRGPEGRNAEAARDLLLPEKRWMAAWDRYMADRAPARPGGARARRVPGLTAPGRADASSHVVR